MTRRALLLAAIRAEGGDWTTGRVHHLYRSTGVAPGRRTARRDLRHLARAGHLAQRPGTHTYTPAGEAA